MMARLFFSLALSFLPFTTAHIAGRQAAGSLMTTSAIPSAILTAGAESITDTAALATATALSTALSSITGTTIEATKVSSSSPTPTSSDSTTNDTNAPLDTSTSSKNYAHLGTVVGLTIGFSFFVLLLVSGLFLVYRRRQRNNRTYGIAKSRSQRLDQPLPQQRSWHGQPSMEDHRQGMVLA